MSIECTELNLLQAPEETIAGMVISLNTIRSINFTAVIILALTPKIWVECLLCYITNRTRNLHTTESTGNERFPIGHGTNYFRFGLTFSLFTRKQLPFLPICLQYVL